MKRERGVLAAAAAPPLILAAIVYAAGSRPYADAWAYARVVHDWLAGGELRLNGWVVASFVFQGAWGALFAKLGGFSFTALRLSTLVWAALGPAALYDLLRSNGLEPKRALGGALTLAANPLYLFLSWTFMTDVPALSLALIAAALYSRGLLLPGALAAACAALTRQTALAVPLGFAAHALLEGRKQDAAKIALLPVLAYLAFLGWLHGVHGLPEFYNARTLLSGAAAAHQAPGRLVRAAQTLGLALLPLLAGFGLRRDGWKPALWSAAAAYVLLGASAALFLLGARGVPYFSNVLWDFGFGPMALNDAYIRGLNVPPGWSALCGRLFGLAGAAAAALALRERRGRPAPHPLLFAAAATAAWLLLIDDVFDRYLLELLPAAILGAALAARPRAYDLKRTVGAALLSLVLSASAAHIFHAWNRARWDAADHAVRELGADPLRVDGGFAWNGWNNYAAFGERHRVDPENKLSWWWVRDPHYMVAFGKLEGWTVNDRFLYRYGAPLVLLQRPHTE